MQITRIGLDIAKNVFQVHGIDAAEKVVVRKQLRRGQVMKFFETVETVDRETREVPREERTRAFVWDRSADHIRASGHGGCIAKEAILQAKTGRIHDCTRTLRRYVRFLLHRGRRPYMTHQRHWLCALETVTRNEAFPG